MNKHSRSLLLGMLLGDGCLKTKKHTQSDGTVSTYYEYVLCHSTKQEDYLRIKLELFHSIIGGKKPKICYESPKLSNGETYSSCRFSKCDKSFKLLHKYLYSKNNKKYITERVLKYLTPQAIAIWYMDDGGLSKSKREDGSVSSVQMRLNTYCTELEADNIVTYFNTLGINPNKNKYGQKDQWNIRFNTGEAKKFELLVKDYVIPSMMYKLPSNWIPRVPDILTDDDIV